MILGINNMYFAESQAYLSHFHMRIVKGSRPVYVYKIRISFWLHAKYEVTTDLRRMDCLDVNWIGLIHYRIQWPSFVMIAMLSSVFSKR
jgi:hypothetical protein